MAGDVLTGLAARFGARLQAGAPLARYTAARIGGPADGLLVVRSRDELAAAVQAAWAVDWPLLVLGGGANVLVADAGFRGLVVINKAQRVRFDFGGEAGTVYADSGAALSTLARRCIERGLGGLEWAASIPGSVGGAVINNAGAHGGDMAGVVRTVEVLPRGGTAQTWPVEAMGYAYRASCLKGREDRAHLVLGAALALAHDDPAALRARAGAFVAHRKATQPPGASLGSIFKNPPGDYAGRLIDAAGLKGFRIGAVQVSPVHANFFVNTGGATAADYRALIDYVRAAVQERWGVMLELEIEIIDNE
ncbi:MAG: UDP-N-acetylmuramate dehydrogenase [Anaerolineae bacterium]|nr:UDP-N-acetylmuramate dehydrogenase [Anaerolineae bacterium]